MKKLVATLSAVALLAGTMALSAIPVQAEDDEATLCSYCWEKGSFTEENPEASRVLLLPLRLVTAGVGAPVGALVGTAEGVAEATGAVADVTFGKIATDKYDDSFTNATVTVLKFPFLTTLGVVGTAAAIPTGATYGMVKGAITGTAKGFMFPDTF